jgi:2,5-diketo-D-gluconate reductase B
MDRHATVQGTSVPALGFGTWQLSGGEAREGVRHALELGYRHVDTAQLYANEDMVGEGIRASGVDRDELFLATKLGPDALAPETVRQATEASLRRLGTDRVELLYIHWPSRDVPLAGTLEAMRALVDEGTVAHIGVSNFPPSLLEEALAEAPVLANQVEYHPYLSQDDLLTLAARHDVLTVSYSPLARGAILDDPAIRQVAVTHGRTPGQVVLRWLLQQGRVAAIPKSASAARRAENADVFDFTLSDDEMKQVAGLDRGLRLIDPPFAPDWER